MLKNTDTINHYSTWRPFPDDYTVLAELVYVDNMQNLKDACYRRPELDALCADLKTSRRGHSALDDVKILKTVCTMKSEEMLQNPYGYTFIDIISYLNTKLPILIICRTG